MGDRLVCWVGLGGSGPDSMWSTVWEAQYICCDVRKFDLTVLGKFGVIMAGVLAQSTPNTLTSLAISPASLVNGRANLANSPA